MRTCTVLLMSLNLAVVSNLVQAKNEATVLINHKGRVIEVAESAVPLHIKNHGDTIVPNCTIPTREVLVTDSGDDFVEFAVTYRMCSMDQVWDLRNNMGNENFGFVADDGAVYICEVHPDSDLPVLAVPFTIRLGCF